MKIINHFYFCKKKVAYPWFTAFESVKESELKDVLMTLIINKKKTIIIIELY